MNHEQIKQIVDSKNINYAVLMFDDNGYNISRTRRIQNPSVPPSANPYQSGMKYSYTAFSFFNFKFTLLISETNKVVTRVGFGNGDLIKCDILFMVQQMARLVEAGVLETKGEKYYNVDDNIKTVQGKILLIPLEFLKEGENVKIPKFYKYKFEVKSITEVDSIALTKNPNYSYIKIVWSIQHQMYMWSVVNIEDSRILSITGFGGVHYGVDHDVPEVIKVKHLPYIVSQLAQMLNNRYK